jgi:Flp pilus assembly protein TadG
MPFLRFLARRRKPASRGQSLVEFSLVLIPFVFILMGIFDLGRGIYQMNGAAEAAREIARVTSVHSSSQTAAVVATQQSLIPALSIDTSTDITCVDISDTVKPDPDCEWGVDYVRVRVRSSFTPITPIVSMFGSHTFESYSRVRYYP